MLNFAEPAFLRGQGRFFLRRGGRGLRAAAVIAAIAMMAFAFPPPDSVKAGRAVVKADPEHPLVVGYLPQWGMYGDSPWYLKNLVATGEAGLLDQLNYSQAGVRNGRCVIADPEADTNHSYAAADSIDGKADPAQPVPLVRTVDADPASAPVTAAPLRGGFRQLELFRKEYPHVRTVISLEGKAPEFAKAALPENRVAFVASCLDTFVRGHLGPGLEAPGLFGGIDLDWEFPQAGEGENYMALVEEFRRQMDALERERAVHGVKSPHLLLTLAVGPGTGRYPGVDWTRMGAVADEVGLMNYDYAGPWQKQTGMIAPLYAIPGDPKQGNTVDATVHEYEGAGVPAGKLLVGVPFYGYGWHGVAGGENHGLFQPGQAVHGDSPYRTIAALETSSTVYRDAPSATPWLYDGDAFWTFDDPVSARAKAAYAARHGLKGVMVWELSGDSQDGALLRALAQGTREPGSSPPGAARPAATGLVAQGAAAQ